MREFIRADLNNIGFPCPELARVWKIAQLFFLTNTYQRLVLKEEKMKVDVKKVTKGYGNLPILQDCSFKLQEGKIYALVGVNGAGKSTLMKLIAGFLEPEDGEILISGRNVWENREGIQRDLGSMIEVPVFYESLSARENLAHHLAYMGPEGTIDSIHREVGLGAVGEKPVMAFSVGMRQRLAIARAMIHRPELLILDEPLNGMDPLGSEKMKGFLRSQADKGTTILISSHILQDVYSLADEVGVLTRGKVEKEFYMEEYNEKNLLVFEKEVLHWMRGGVS